MCLAHYLSSSIKHGRGHSKTIWKRFWIFLEPPRPSLEHVLSISKTIEHLKDSITLKNSKKPIAPPSSSSSSQRIKEFEVPHRRWLLAWGLKNLLRVFIWMYKYYTTVIPLVDILRPLFYVNVVFQWPPTFDDPSEVLQWLSHDVITIFLSFFVC